MERYSQELVNNTGSSANLTEDAVGSRLPYSSYQCRYVSTNCYSWSIQVLLQCLTTLIGSSGRPVVPLLPDFV